MNGPIVLFSFPPGTLYLQGTLGVSWPNQFAPLTSSREQAQGAQVVAAGPSCTAPGPDASSPLTHPPGKLLVRLTGELLLVSLRESCPGHHHGPRPLAQLLPPFLRGQTAVAKPRLQLPLLARGGATLPKSRPAARLDGGLTPGLCPGSWSSRGQHRQQAPPTHAQPGTSKTLKAQDRQGQTGVIMFPCSPGTGGNLA